MKKIICLVLLALVVMALLLGGCGSKDDIKSQEDASDAMTDVGQDVEDIAATLDEIDEGLG